MLDWNKKTKFGKNGSYAHKLFSQNCSSLLSLYCSSFLAPFILLKCFVNLRCFISDGILHFRGRHENIVQNPVYQNIRCRIWNRERAHRAKRLIYSYPHLNPWLNIIFFGRFSGDCHFYSESAFTSLFHSQSLVPIAIMQKPCQICAELVLVIIWNKFRFLVKYQK